MKHRYLCMAILVSLIMLIGATTGCIAVVEEAPAQAPTTEQPIPPPLINSFAASPTSISQGERTTLSWDVSGDATVTIEPGIGTVGSSGSLLMTPGSTVTYTLTATNRGGSNNRSVSVAVAALVAGKPDLMITDVWLSGSQVNYKIANMGSGEAKSSQSELYINNIKHASDWVEPLAAGEERSTTFPNFSWEIQGGADPVTGDPIGHYVRVCADAGSAIDESNKDNNCLTKNWGQPFSFDFFDNAHLAEWRSGAAVIIWPKFAGNQAGAAYTEGTALIMCPEQVSNGWIQGRFARFYYNPDTKLRRSSLIQVPENARFTAEVGFRLGTTSTDGAIVGLGYLDEAGSIMLLPKMELNPGDKDRVYSVDLSSLAGKETEFFLRVEAKDSPEGDCVRWMEPRIVAE